MVVRLRIVAAVGAWVMFAVIVALVTGMPRWRWAWVPMGVLFVVVPSQLAWQLTPAGRRARVPVVLAMLAGLAAGLVATAVAPLSSDELRAVEHRFVLPDTWTQTDEDATGGALCLERCPTVTWEWQVDARPSEAAADAVAVLRSAGFRVVVSERADGLRLAADSGRVQADAVVTGGTDRSTATVRLSLTTSR